jgi:hypothetical protein
LPIACVVHVVDVVDVVADVVNAVNVVLIGHVVNAVLAGGLDPWLAL